MLIMLLFSYKPYDKIIFTFFIFHFKSNLFSLKPSTCWYMYAHIYENINKCRYRVRGTGTIHIREKYMRKEYKC